MSKEKNQLDSYLNTISRLEPELAAIDTGPALASIAISLRRIADVVEGDFFERMSRAIAEGLYNGRSK